MGLDLHEQPSRQQRQYRKANTSPHELANLVCVTKRTGDQNAMDDADYERQHTKSYDCGRDPPKLQEDKAKDNDNGGGDYPMSPKRLHFSPRSQVPAVRLRKRAP